MTFGDKSIFAIDVNEATIDADLCCVDIYLKGKNICCDENFAYLPSFIWRMELSINNLIARNSSPRFEKYFEKRTPKEIHRFILLTRSERSKYYGIENDEIYSAFRILAWGETTDGANCFFFPKGNSHHLTFQLWRTHHLIKSEIGIIHHVSIAPNDVIDVIRDALEFLRALCNRIKQQFKVQ